MMNVLYAIVTAYLIGSIPTSYWMGRLKGIDVRKEGSGNVGATNVLRTVGKIPAILTLIVDILKGVVAVTFMATYFYKNVTIVNFDLYRALVGLSVIAGHNWSIFLKFRGGKGVATSFGVMMVLLPHAAAIGLVVFIITVAATKYISLGSILLSITLPIASVVMGEPIELVFFGVCICILICYRHKSNINRLISGTENKIGGKKS